MAMQLERSTLPPSVQSVVTEELAPLRSLEQVARWAFTRSPPCDVADVLVQDEYTHDVVIPWAGVHLVFDTT